MAGHLLRYGGLLINDFNSEIKFVLNLGVSLMLIAFGGLFLFFQKQRTDINSLEAVIRTGRWHSRKKEPAQDLGLSDTTAIRRT